MAIRAASAVWNGNLKEGQGRMKLGSGAFEGPFTFSSRFENGRGTNPEELLGAAHAGCFSMFLSAMLTTAGFTAKEIRTSAKVHLGKGPSITLIELETEAEIPVLDEKTFLENVEKSKLGCPVSVALAGTEIRVTARLVK